MALNQAAHAAEGFAIQVLPHVFRVAVETLEPAGQRSGDVVQILAQEAAHIHENGIAAHVKIFFRLVHDFQEPAELRDQIVEDISVIGERQEYIGIFFKKSRHIHDFDFEFFARVLK